MSTASDGRPMVNPAAISIPDAARLLSRVGGRALALETLEQDVASGAPTNADGTINLVHYAAWLMHEVGRNAGDPHGD